MSTKYIASNWRLPNQENSSKSDNYGLTFDGSELIDVNYTPPSDWFNNGFSISAWVYPTSPNNDTIIGAYSGGRFYWRLYDTNKWWVGFGSWNDATTVNSVTSDEWQHIVLTYTPSDTTIRFYRNGISDGSIVRNLAGSSMPNIAYPLNIGVTNQSSNSGYFNGSISQCCLYDYTLSESQISTLYGSSSLGAGNPMALKPQPVAFWNLADNSTSNPLTQPNEAVADASVFNFDSASSNYIDLTQIDLGTVCTISMWLKKESGLLSATILGEPTNTFKNVYYVDWNANTLYFKDPSNNFVTWNTLSSVNNTDWHHYVVTRNGGNTVLYLDGVSQGAGTVGSALTGNTKFRYLGVNYPTNTQFFNGKISNCQLWNTELSASEVTTLYNSGVPLLTGTQPQASSLRAWYKLDQSANWEADSSAAWQIPDAVSAYPQSFEILSNDSIDFTNGLLSDLSAFTISFWYNRAAANGATATLIKQNGVISINQYRQSASYSGLEILLTTVNGQSNILSTSQGNVPTGEWLHVGIVYDGSNMILFRNGSQAAGTYNPVAATGNTVNNTNVFEIFAQTSLQYGISNLQVFDSALPATGTDSVETLYNNGSPLTTAIASDNLKLWAKLDNTATFSTNWSIPDASGNGNTGTSSGMTEQNLVNNNVSVLNGTSSGMTSANLVLSDLSRSLPYGDGYSFNFDSASSDYIDCGNSTDLQFSGSFSVSCWAKFDNTGNNAIISKDSNINTGAGYHIDFRGGSEVHAWAYNAANKLEKTGLSQNTWYHIVFVFESTGGTNGNQSLYINGGTPVTNSITNFAASTIKNLRIGASEVLSGFFTDGKISNISVFNESLTSTEVMKLYSNGVPQDLTNFTPQPVAFYPLGSNSFWNGSQWTVRDMIGSNDGTGQNIGVDGLVGDAPRSEANGTGTNMDVPSNLEGSTKWSDNNSWSINMSETARVEDTP